MPLWSNYIKSNPGMTIKLKRLHHSNNLANELEFVAFCLIFWLGDDLQEMSYVDHHLLVSHRSGDVQEMKQERDHYLVIGIDHALSIIKEVGLFPDVLKHRVKQHFDKGDQVSTLITREIYTKKEHFPRFGCPFVFNAEVLEAANLAQWEDEQIEYIKEKVTDEGRQADLKKGKEPTQVALDEAAFLLDLASLEGKWDDCLVRIAECYKEAGLDDIAKFLVYRD
ncbi:unnamed protein product [Fraxinus pennsylvanica]|uniref:Uncharacterized protein n=1 Tax=Fraxinus pennsylvanica TaxID=56036 RepID=A0AAD2DSU6_9LAMI|nr:unnamed protein product [Fraxinus pennsylvanica]